MSVGGGQLEKCNSLYLLLWAPARLDPGTIGWQTLPLTVAGRSERQLSDSCRAARPRGPGSRDQRTWRCDMYRKILLPTNGSALCESAVQKGIDLARSMGA